jgi:hypothetical protein
MLPQICFKLKNSDQTFIIKAKKKIQLITDMY